MSERWYDKTIQQIEQKLNTDINTGLSTKELRKKQRKGYDNAIFPIPHHSFGEYLKKILTEPTILLLLAIALLSAVLEKNTAACVIMGIVAFNCIISVITYTKAQQVLEDMGHLSIPTSKVMRNGKLYLIKSEQLYEGDVIYLSAGDMVPCDARLIEQNELSVLEVNLTGIVKPVEKDPLFIRYTHDIPPAEQANMIFASTIIVKGTAKAVICCTGEDTLVCKLGKNKPLVTHEKIGVISILQKYSRIWSLILIGIIFVLTFIDLFTGIQSRGLYEIFLTGLSLAAASAGELHIASAYVIIASGLFATVKQNKDINSGALIKNASKIEALKKTTCLLINKEGAFSLRNLRVQKIYANSALYDEKDIHFAENSEKVIKHALISTGLYGAGRLVRNNLNNDNIYSAEEDAIIGLSQRCKVYNIELDKQYPILDRVKKSESSRFETTLVNNNGEFIVNCRGDLNTVLAVCTMYSENGRVYPFDPDKKAEVIYEAAKLLRNSYRIIGVCTKKTHYNSLVRILSCQSDMTFEGFLAIKENMLPGVAKNIAQCHAAGIKVIMMSDDVGDHNIALAESLGIIKDKKESVTGKELSHMKDDLIRTNTAVYRLYQGLNIGQKRRLLEHLKSDGETVGVLSRELNEIILLKESDIGFIQRTTLSGKLDKNGIDMAENVNLPIYIKNPKDSKKTGSEAMKFVADVIISDGDKKGSGGFNAIVDSIAASKAIYQNLVKMVKYVLITHIARVLIVLCSILTDSVLFKPEQILFCGLVVDFSAMMIISFEHADTKIFMQKENSEEQLNSIYKYLPFALLTGGIWAAVTVIIPLLYKFFGLSATSEINSTLVFVGLLLSQLAVLNELLRETGVFSRNVRFNRVHIIVILLMIVFLICSSVFPKFGVLFGISGMKSVDWLFTLIPTVVMIIIFEIKKLVASSKE